MIAHCFPKAVLSIFVAAFLCNIVRADFSGPYAVPEGGIFFPNDLSSATVGAWELKTTSTYTYANAYLFTHSNEIDFNTGISNLEALGVFMDITLTTVIPADGILSFDYSVTLLTTGFFDDVNYAGYLLDGVLTKLPAGSGAVSVPVSSGDIFGFEAHADTDCITCQPPIVGGTMLTITNFNAPIPEPSVVTLFLTAVPVLLVAYRRRLPLRSCSCGKKII
jgi:hypothetical protein